MSAAVLGQARCGGGDGSAKGRYAFPQGVASGDPRASSVVLWTRVERTAGGDEAVDLSVEVATDAAFANVVASRMVQAVAASDHTVRVVVTDLSPATGYYYRFTAGSDTIDGRTRTAPAADADVPVYLAWVSCEDYTAGNYGAYRQLLLDDDARSEDQKIQLVVFLGDFIYESTNEFFQKPVDDHFNPVPSINADGTPRTLPALPSGGDVATTLADYRTLYKTYLTDPDLRAARARWPFISIWDDHEFTNDAWQSMANWDGAASTDEPSQTRRLAASQAWFEFVPSQLTGADDVLPGQAKDFTPVTVVDAPFTQPNDDNFVDEPNNVAAIGAITIYRSFRIGKHLELVMTDLRSYRSDHPIPEELIADQGLFFDLRNFVPIEMVNAFDAGRTANGGAPPDSVLGFPNPRKNSPAGTIMGVRQKQWFKDTMKAADATWKVWGTSVFLMRARIQSANGLEILAWDRILDSDAWDGYHTERNELLSYLRDEEIKNVVAICGDIHAQFAGFLWDDYDAANPNVVGVELVAAAITTKALLAEVEEVARTLPESVRGVITFQDDNQNEVDNMNLLLMEGTAAAVTYAKTKDLQQALAKSDPTHNAHLQYVDTNSQGYGLLTVESTQITGELVTINHPILATGTQGPGVKRRARFVIPKDNPAGMTGPEITGTKPPPFG